MGQIELDAERELVDNFLREVMQAHPEATYGEMMIRSTMDQRNLWILYYCLKAYGRDVLVGIVSHVLHQWNPQN